ncbi:MAG: hypothetical protein MZV49_16875 [Rhodopseudomonas palustris]|nr:hypothetical protein [Rhodopseudomonas palustris]
MTDLFGQPLLEHRTGGNPGGGAHLTPTGLRVIEVLQPAGSGNGAGDPRARKPELAGSGITPSNLVSGCCMKTSARSALAPAPSPRSPPTRRSMPKSR